MGSANGLTRFRKQMSSFISLNTSLGDRRLEKVSVGRRDAEVLLLTSKSRSNGYRGSSSIKYPISYDLPIIGYGFRVIGQSWDSHRLAQVSEVLTYNS